MTTTAAKILNQLADEARETLRTTIDLDGFLALSGDERAARWRQFDRAAKWQLVAQQIERRYGDWETEEVEIWVARYDAKWSTAPAPAAATDRAIPPSADILALVADRQEQAVQHDDWSGARQLDRVRMNIKRGAALAWDRGDLLVSSVNTPGAVYAVSRRGCTCPNGAAGKAACWHVALYDLLLDMQEEAATTADMEADRVAERQLGCRLAAARRALVEA